MNELVNLQIRLYKNENNHRELLANLLNKFKYLYSYIVCDKKDYWQVDILYSKTKQYNTIPVDALIERVIKSEKNPNKSLQLSNNICDYCQPPLEILLVTYRPLIYRLAVQQHTYWPQIELEDLIQMCNLRICILYQQGYYIHKKLLNRAFANAVLMFLRPERYKPHIASLDEISDSKSGGDENVSPLEVIEDESASEEIQNAIDEMDGYTFEDLLSSEMRNVVLEFVSQRTYDQWKIEYGTKTVSRQTASQVNALKSKLSALGISCKSITDYIIRRR